MKPVDLSPQGITTVRARPVPPTPQSSLNLGDIYYTLFRHKWKILLCTVAGLLAATLWVIYRPLPYQSEAKLFIRYVVFEGPAQSPVNDDLVMKSPDMRGETIMSSEQEILTSFDVAKQVAQAIGPAKILASTGGGNSLDRAASVISSGLTAGVPRHSSVIVLDFKSPNAALVQPVLQEVITQYLKRHVEIHQAAGMVGDFLSQETDQLRVRLSQTEDALRKAKAKAGVLSVDDAMKNYSTEMATLREQIFAAQAELAEREAGLQELAKEDPDAATATAATAAAPAPSPAVREQYALVSARLDSLRKREQELLLQFTSENSMVKDVRTQIADAQAAKQKLESAHPGLLRAAAAANLADSAQPNQGPALNLAVENGRVIALKARIKVLNQQWDSVRGEAAKLESMEGTIDDLKRRQALEESNYKRYAASLEQSRINEAMGSGKVSNISVIQSPSPPFVDLKKALKIPGGLAVLGLFAGFGWAFLIELVLDRSIRRPKDVEKKLHLPLFISIPRLSPRSKRRLLRLQTKKRSAAAAGGGDGSRRPEAGPSPQTNGAELALPNGDPLLRPFHETLRDRLIGYFERRNLTHKPKLVAVTGIGGGAGVTTTASGLASCLSETGEGNVLLVDLAPGQGAARQFYRGKTVSDIDAFIAARDNAQVQDKLYVVSENRGSELLSGILPQRFKSLVPKLKATDFDYIIFDMPPVSQISITPRLAGFMDLVLLVTESEKTNMDLVQRARSLLEETDAHVGVVLNKQKTYVPTMIQQEDLGN